MENETLAIEKLDFTIPVLGEATVQSQILLSREKDDYLSNYVQDNQYIFYNIETGVDPHSDFTQKQLLEKAGPSRLQSWLRPRIRRAV